MLKSPVDANESMPKYIFAKLRNRIADNNEKFFNVLILEKSYKANIKDIRRSQSIELYKMIKEENYNTEIWDPSIDEIAIDLSDKKKILVKKLNNADIIILGCPHKILLDEDYTKYKIHS